MVDNSNRCFSTCFWDYLTPFTNFWGVFTSVVLCGVGADLYVHHHAVGFYIILATLVLFVLEIDWVITLFLKVCIQDEYSRIVSCWNKIMWMRHWRKAIIYFVFAIVLICKKYHFWLTTISGVMLLILGSLHFLLTWKKNLVRKYSKDGLLDNPDDYCERFENEEIDNIILPKDEITGVVIDNNE